MQRVAKEKLTGDPVVDLCLELGVSDVQVVFLAYKHSVEKAPYEFAAAALEHYRETGEVDDVVVEFAIDVLSNRFDVQPREMKALPRYEDCDPEE